MAMQQDGRWFSQTSYKNNTLSLFVWIWLEFSPCGTGGWGFYCGRVALKAALSKMAKHIKVCSDNQHVFIPFAFDTFGFLAPDVEVRHCNVVSPKSINVVFQRLNFAIPKGLISSATYCPSIFFFMCNYFIYIFLSAIIISKFDFFGTLEKWYIWFIIHHFFNVPKKPNLLIIVTGGSIYKYI
jgi:hypothetical protein